MPSMAFIYHTNFLLGALFCIQFYTPNLQAAQFELTSMIGKSFNANIVSSDNTTSILSTNNEPNYTLAFAWEDSPRGQGQILVNYISRDFPDDKNKKNHTLDTVYVHFSGVALFKQINYVTTVGFGVGATYFNSDYDAVIYPSMTATIGTRYEFSDNLALVTELRGYATLTDTDDALFCQTNRCVAKFDSTLWIDTQISIGVAYGF